MKVLQINNVYEYGSTGKITADIHHELKRQGIQSVVCYGRREKTQEEHVHKICGEFESHVYHFWANLSGVMYGGCGPSTRRLIRIIEKEQPDIVHLQCLNGYFVNIYKLVSWLKEHHIKTVLTLHAEFMHTANCGHALDCDRWRTGCGKCPRLKRETGSYLWDRTDVSWQRMKRAFDGFEENLAVVSVSPWLMQRAKESPIFEKMSHSVVYNGLDTTVFKPYPVAELRKRHGLTDEKIIFHATPSFSTDPAHIKGGYYVLELAKRMTGKPVKFIVAGPHEENLQVPGNVILLGSVTDQKLLAQYYSMADVTLLTSRKETFSMVTAESLCCGTPVVGFKAGAPEMIAIPAYSRFCEYGDLDALEKETEFFLYSDFGGDSAEQAQNIYSAEQMAENYLNCYRSILGSSQI